MQNLFLMVCLLAVSISADGRPRSAKPANKCPIEKQKKFWSYLTDLQNICNNEFKGRKKRPKAQTQQGREAVKEIDRHKYVGELQTKYAGQDIATEGGVIKAADFADQNARLLKEFNEKSWAACVKLRTAIDGKNDKGQPVAGAQSELGPECDDFVKQYQKKLSNIMDQGKKKLDAQQLNADQLREGADKTRQTATDPKVAGTDSEGTPIDGTQPLKADKDGKIDPAEFHQRALEKIKAAGLGRTPESLEHVGIKKGTPEEWAEFFTKLQQQESNHRIAPGIYDRNGQLVGLQRFPTTPPGEMSFGPGQFNRGEYGLRTWGDVNNPDRVIDAYINVARAGRIRDYFGSVQRPREVNQWGNWFNTKVRPRLNARSLAFNEEENSPFNSLTKTEKVKAVLDEGEGEQFQFTSDFKTDQIQRMIANHDFCGAQHQIRKLAQMDTASSVTADTLKAKLEAEMEASSHPAGDFGMDLMCEQDFEPQF